MIGRVSPSAPWRGASFVGVAALVLLVLAFAPSSEAAKGDDGSTPTGSGYVWIDEVAGTGFFNWENSGTNYPYATTVYDRSTADTLPAGFSHKFYGTTHGPGSDFWVNEDGFIAYTVPAGDTFAPQAIPDTADPDHLIAPFWIDLDTACAPTYPVATGPPAVGRIRSDYLTTGIHPRLTVTWDNVDIFDAWSCKGDTVSFQLKLFDESDVIEYHIPDGQSEIRAGAFCKAFRVGTENSAGTSALDVRGYSLGNGCAGAIPAGGWTNEERRIWDNELDDVDDQFEVADGGPSPAAIDIDLDTSDDPLQYSNYGGPSKGTVASFPSGLKYVPQTVTYTPNINTFGPDSFNYEVEDGYDAKQSGKVTVCLNSAPEANDDSKVIDQDSGANTITVTTNDKDDYWSDADPTTCTANPAVKITSVASGSLGVATISADKKSIVYTPNAGVSGTETLTYTVDDGRLTDTADLTIHINAEPVAVDDDASGPYVVDQDTLNNALDVLANDSDSFYSVDEGAVSNPALKVSNILAGAGGSPVAAADLRSILYTPNGGFAGQDSFTYDATDGRMSDTATVTVDVNAPPVSGALAFVIDQDSLAFDYDVVAVATDAYYGELALESVDAWSSGTASAENGLLRYTPASLYFGAASVDYTVTDGRLTAGGTIDFDINAPPTANDDTYSVDRDSENNVLAVLSNDIDAHWISNEAPNSGNLIISSIDSVTGGVANVVQNKIVFTPDAGFVGEATLEYTISDGRLPHTASVTIDVIVPVTTGPDVAINEILNVDEAATGVISSDELMAAVDGVPATQIVYTVTVAPMHGELLKNGGTLTGTFTQADIDADKMSYRHDGSETISDSFKFSVSDADGATSGTFKISVNPLNDAWVATINVLDVGPGQQVVLKTTALQLQDPDTPDDSLQLTIITLPNHSDVLVGGVAKSALDSFSYADLVGGLVELWHDGVGSGGDALVLEISDGTTVAQRTITLVTDPANQPPSTARPVSDLWVTQGASVQVDNRQLDWTDDYDSAAGIRFELVSTPQFGRLHVGGIALGAGSQFSQADVNQGLVTYVQSGQYALQDTIHLRVLDTTGKWNGIFTISGLELSVKITPTDGAADNDTDGDGIEDSLDNCPYVPNTLQIDADGKNGGNACDPAEQEAAAAGEFEDEAAPTSAGTADSAGKVSEATQTATTYADLDQDGRFDHVDNCPSIPNVAQLDLDRDGLGDACDNDMDGDGILERGGASGLVDNCPLRYNPDQADDDRDGTGNVCETDDRLRDTLHGDCDGCARNPDVLSDDGGAAAQAASSRNAPLVWVGAGMGLLILVGGLLSFWGLRTPKTKP